MPKAKNKKKQVELKTFRVYGTFMFSDGQQDFIKVIKAGKESQAIDKTYKLVGSQHHAKRRNIKINKIEVS